MAAEDTKPAKKAVTQATIDKHTRRLVRSGIESLEEGFRKGSGKQNVRLTDSPGMEARARLAVSATHVLKRPEPAQPEVPTNPAPMVRPKGAKGSRKKAS